jgi:polyferredoxin
MTPSENQGREARDPAAGLRVVKVLHTIAWAFFAGCIIAIPVVSWRGNNAAAAWLSVIVLVEVLVLVLNRWRCPLTAVAARYTNDRRDNFDIYLPQWLARHNKVIFGALYIAGLVFALARWITLTR